MSSGYIHIYYERGVVPELATFETLLAPIGLHLEAPSGRVCAISPEGDQIVVTREWILAEVAGGSAVSFQWWYSDSDDVYCRFNPGEHDQWSVEFGLDGVDEASAEVLTRIVFDYFKEQCATGGLSALVVDASGDLEETDWYAVVSGRERLQLVPDLLVLPRRVLNTTSLPQRKLANCPEHVLFTTNPRDSVQR